MRLAFACLAALLALILFSGTPHAAECSASYGCGYKEICQNGQCVYDALSCKYDSECGVWEYCNTGTYQCARSQGRCVADSDCYGQAYCDANHYCADRQPADGPGGILGTALNNTTNRSLSDFGSTNPALNKTIQGIKKSVNSSMARAEQQSKGSVGGFFAWFFELLRRLFFGG